VKYPKKELSCNSFKVEFHPTPRQTIILKALFTTELKEHFVKALENEYNVGCETGFEEAKKQLLAKIKEKKDLVCLAKEIEDTPTRDGKLKVLKWLECELKDDSVSSEIDTVKEGGLK